MANKIAASPVPSNGDINSCAFSILVTCKPFTLNDAAATIKIPAFKKSARLRAITESMVLNRMAFFI